MNHSFNTEYARKYGIEEAIVIENFIFWIKKNHANSENIKEIEIDGVKEQRVFTYNSAKALAELFPYFSEKQIYRIMESLEKQSILIKAHFNSNNHNRITWYCFKDQNSFLEIGKWNHISIPEKEKSNSHNREIHLPKKENHYTDINQIENKNIEEEIKNSSTPSKVLEKQKEESSFANRMLDLKDVVSSPVLNRQEAFQRMVNTISRVKKREKGELTGYDSMNKNETANLYCLVEQFQGNENVVLKILETMLEYQKSGKLKLYSEILRTTTKHTNPNFWNQATISAFYIVKFASDKEVIDTAIRENEIYQEHLKRKKEQATFAKSPEAKLNIPIDPEFAKQLKELKDKPVDKVDELEVKRKSDLEKMKSVLAATPKKCIFEIEREQEEKRKDILIKIELQKKVV